MSKTIWILEYRFIAGSKLYPWYTEEYDNLQELTLNAKNHLLEGDEVKMYDKSFQTKEHLEAWNSFEYNVATLFYPKKEKEQ